MGICCGIAGWPSAADLQQAPAADSLQKFAGVRSALARKPRESAVFDDRMQPSGEFLLLISCRFSKPAQPGVGFVADPAGADLAARW
jgi:hypothetical protein